MCGYVRRCLRTCNYDYFCQVDQNVLTRCMVWRKHNPTDRLNSYLDTLWKTGSEGIAITLRKRWILFVNFEARVEDTRPPKFVVIKLMDRAESGQ